VLAAVVIGTVLSGPTRDAASRSPPAASWNTSDAACVQAMLWHQQQARSWPA
jgi:hypothetical protein